MFYANVAEGIHRVEDSFTNWYLIEEEGRLTVVDTGVPTSWPSLIEALKSLGRRLSDIEAVVLTHAPLRPPRLRRARPRRPRRRGLGARERRSADPSAAPVRARADPPSTTSPPSSGRRPMVVAFVRNRAWWPKPVKGGPALRGRDPAGAWLPRRSSLRPGIPWAIARCTCPTGTASSPGTR